MEELERVEIIGNRVSHENRVAWQQVGQVALYIGNRARRLFHDFVGDAAVLGEVVDDQLGGLHERLVDGLAALVDDRHGGEALHESIGVGVVAFDHFAIDREHRTVVGDRRVTGGLNEHRLRVDDDEEDSCDEPWSI